MKNPFKKPWKAQAENIHLENDVLALVANRFFEDIYNDAKIRNYQYQIVLKQSNQLVGFCELRVGDQEALFYLGNIGYNIFRHHQGHGYAKIASILLMSLAQQIGLKSLSITCNTDNHASIKTIEALKPTRQLGYVVVPASEPLFQQGDYYKYIYEFDLRG